MAKRNNRADFDDFDDYIPAGQSSYNSDSADTDRARPDLDNWAEDPPRSRQKNTRRRSKSASGRWFAAVAALSLLVAVVLFMLRPDNEDELRYQEDTEPADITTQYEPLQTEPPETYFQPVTQPQLPPVTEPPVTEPPVTEPPATQPPVTQPPVTEPSVPETTQPQATGVQLLLQQEAQVIEDKYGVTVYVGEQCDTVYGDFSVKITQEYDEVVHEIQMLDHVLSRYPENFFREICNSWWTSVRIYLVRDIWGNGPSFVGDGYAGYGGAQEDYYFMVLDIDDTYEELSHIIDNYLNDEASQRQDVLFSDETWAAQNPDWFTGYSNDYSVMPQLAEDDWFVDAYGAIAITEDRAQIMAKAMMDGMEDYFAARPGLRKKLEYHAMCLRDAFDTTGWPDVLTWEQYLYN